MNEKNDQTINIKIRAKMWENYKVMLDHSILKIQISTTKLVDLLTSWLYFR